MRKIIDNYFSSLELKSGDVALLLSGGVDSSTCLYSLLDCNIRPSIYSFKLKTRKSVDFDMAFSTSKSLGLTFTPIVIDDLLMDVEKDVRNIISRFNTKKKTAIQVLHPFIYTVGVIKEGNVVSGICADTLQGNSKEFAMSYSRSKEEYMSKRLDSVLDMNDSSYASLKRLFDESGKRLIAPYKECKQLVDYFLAKDYEETMKPQKKFPRSLYPEIKSGNVMNLQIGSGIRELHDKVLLDKYGAKSVTKVYNMFYNQIFGNNGTQIQLSMEI